MDYWIKQVFMNKRTIRCLLAALLALTLVVSVFPQIPAQAKTKNATVSTQAAINNAIASNDINKIIIKTKSDANFTIKGDASGKTIIANTPNANLTVKGAVNSLYINAASGVELNKNADISKIKLIASDNLTLNILSGATVNNLTVGASNNDAKAGSISITNNGSINNLRLNSEDSSVSLKNNKSIGKILLGAPTELDISGKSKSNTPVTVKKAAEGSTITASTAISVNAYASADLNLKRGAGKSAVKVKHEDIDINILNDTKKDIIIIDKNSGASTSVEAGSSMTAENFQNSISDFLVKKAAEAEAAKKAAAEKEAAEKAAAEKEAAEKAAAEHANQSPIPPTSPTTYSERQDIINLDGIEYPCTVKETMTGGRFIATVWTVSEKDYLDVYNASSPDRLMTEEELHSALGIGPYLVKKEAYSYTNNQFELTTNIYYASESLRACTTIVRYNTVMPNFIVDTPCYKEVITYNLMSGAPESTLIQEITADGRKETKITYQKDGTAEQIASGRYNKIETIDEYKNGKEIPFKSTTNMWKRDSEDLEKTEIVELTIEGDKISKKTVTQYMYDESKNTVIFGFNTYYYDYPCDYDKVQSEWSSLEKLSVFKNNDINMPTKKEYESNGRGKISESDLEYNDDGTLSKDTTKLYTDSAVSSTEVSQYTYAGSTKTKTTTTYNGASTVDTDMISKNISTYDLVEGAETFVKEEEINYVDFDEYDIPDFALLKYDFDYISFISSSTAWNYSANEKTFERIGYKKGNDEEDKILYSEVITYKIDGDDIISERHCIYHGETSLLEPVYEYQKNADYGNDRIAYCSETSYNYVFGDNNECTKKVYYFKNSEQYETYKSGDNSSYIYLLRTNSTWMDTKWFEYAYTKSDKNGSYLGKTNLYISTAMYSCLLSDFSDGDYDVTFSGPAVPGWITNIKIVSNGEDGYPDYNNPYNYIETITDENDRIYSEKRYIIYGDINSDRVLEYEFKIGDGCYNDGSTVPTEHEITEYEIDENYAQTKKTVKQYENGTLTSTINYSPSPDGVWVSAQ